MISNNIAYKEVTNPSKQLKSTTHVMVVNLLNIIWKFSLDK